MSELTVGTLRELFRNLLWWRSLYEADGVDTLPTPDGGTISLWDVNFLYSRIVLLPPRQRQAIQLCLIENIREREAAIQMGVSPTNPVAMYATSGLEKLVLWWNAGDFNRDTQRGAFRRLSCRSCGGGVDLHPLDVAGAMTFMTQHQCYQRERSVA